MFARPVFPGFSFYYRYHLENKRQHRKFLTKSNINDVSKIGVTFRTNGQCTNQWALQFKTNELDLLLNANAPI